RGRPLRAGIVVLDLAVLAVVAAEDAHGLLADAGVVILERLEGRLVTGDGVEQPERSGAFDGLARSEQGAESPHDIVPVVLRPLDQAPAGGVLGGDDRRAERGDQAGDA